MAYTKKLSDLAEITSSEQIEEDSAYAIVDYDGEAYRVPLSLIKEKEISEFKSNVVSLLTQVRDAISESDLDSAIDLLDTFILDNGGTLA